MLVGYFKDEYMNRKEINIIYDCYMLPSPYLSSHWLRGFFWISVQPTVLLIS